MPGIFLFDIILCIIIKVPVNLANQRYNERKRSLYVYLIGSERYL